MLIEPVIQAQTSFQQVSRFYPILSHETNQVTAGSNCRERMGFGPI